MTSVKYTYHSDYDPDYEQDCNIIEQSVIKEIEKIFIKDLSNIICEYASYWINANIFYKYLSERCITSIPKDIGNWPCIIDNYITEVIFVHEFAYKNVESTRKVRMYNRNNTKIDYYDLHATLTSYFEEWNAFSIKLCGVDDYFRYNQQGDEMIYPLFKESKLSGTILTIPINIGGMYCMD